MAAPPWLPRAHPAGPETAGRSSSGAREMPVLPGRAPWTCGRGSQPAAPQGLCTGWASCAPGLSWPGARWAECQEPPVSHDVPGLRVWTPLEHPCPAGVQMMLIAVSSEDRRGCSPGPAWKLGPSSAADPPHDTLRDPRLRSPDFPQCPPPLPGSHTPHAPHTARPCGSRTPCLPHVYHMPHTYTTSLAHVPHVYHEPLTPHTPYATRVTHASRMPTTHHTLHHNPQLGQWVNSRVRAKGLLFPGWVWVGVARVPPRPDESRTPRDQLHLPRVWHTPLPQGVHLPWP